MEVNCAVWCLSKFVTIIIITIIRKFNMNFLIPNSSTEDIICEKGGRSGNFICNLLQHPIFSLLFLDRQNFRSFFADFQLANFQHKYHSLYTRRAELQTFQIEAETFSDLPCLAELGSNQSLVLALVCSKLLT